MQRKKTFRLFDRMKFGRKSRTSFLFTFQVSYRKPHCANRSLSNFLSLK